MTISICLIAKNEERCIERCIRSFLPVASEVVVVDTGSSDRTADIAASLGAKVYHFAWIDDFAAAKNYALSKASGDWIVFPDADEYLPGEEAARALLAVVESAHSGGVGAFTLTIRSFLGAGTEDSRYIDSDSARVFRNDPRIRFKRAIHEYVNWTPASAFKKPRIRPEHFMFYHDGYKDDLIAAKDKRDHELLDAQYHSGVISPALLGSLAKYYSMLGRPEESRELFARYFESGYGEDAERSVESIVFYIELLISQKRPYGEMKRALQLGLRDYPEHPGMRLLAGYANYRAKRYPDAIGRFREGFELCDTASEVSGETLLPNGRARFWGVLSEIYALKGESASALSSAKRALMLDPFHPGALGVLAGAAPNEALAFLNERYDLSKPDVLKDLLPAFAANRPGVAFLTLFEKYYGITGQKDINFIAMLAVAGEYALAVDALLARYEASGFEPYLAKALAFALLSGKSGPILTVAQSGSNASGSRENTVLPYHAQREANVSYTRLANMALGKASPEADDLSAFVLTAHFMLGFSGVTPTLEDFASYAARGFGGRALKQLTLLLERHGCHQDALDVVDDALDGAVDAAMLAALMEAGALSAYRMGEYERAEGYLLSARARGAHPYLIGSYAAFIAEKQSGSAKARLEALSEELFALDWDGPEYQPQLLLTEGDLVS